MKKLFISQVIGEKLNEIKNEREELIQKAIEKYGEVEVLDDYLEDLEGSELLFLGKNIMVLGTADIAAFGKGWEDDRDCRIERQCCMEYGVDVIDL